MSVVSVPIERAVFRLTGERPLAYLHDVLAQDVAGLVEGRGALAVALDPKGRVSAEMRVLPLADAVLLDAEPAAREGVIERVGRHAPLAGCELLDASADFELIAVRGAVVDEVLAREEAAFRRDRDVLVVRVGWGGPGVDLLGPGEDVQRMAERYGAREASSEDLERFRVLAGRPRFGVDVDESMLVNETPLLHRAVALGKGCYPGQESVARVLNLGGVRRLLRGLRSDDELQRGAEVRHDATQVGVLTSAVLLPDGGAAAIGRIRSELEPGTVVDVEGAKAEISELV